MRLCHPKPSKFNSYASDILSGLGWQDIAVKHKIKSARAQHYIREAVLRWHTDEPEIEYSNGHWQRVSGFYQDLISYRSTRAAIKAARHSRSGHATPLRRFV